MLNRRFGDEKRFDFGLPADAADKDKGEITHGAPTWNASATPPAWTVPDKKVLDLNALINAAKAGGLYNIDANNEIPPDELAELITANLTRC